MSKKEMIKLRGHHESYEPAYLTGFGVIVAAFLFDFLSASGIIIVGAIAASAVILSHKYRHHLTTLGTITFAYIVSAVLAIPIAYMLRIGGVPLGVQIFTMLFGIGYLLHFLNVFHPPAVAFAAAFILYERGIAPYLVILVASIVAFTAIRLVIYIVHDHLTVRDFRKELIREEKSLLKKEKRIIRI